MSSFGQISTVWLGARSFSKGLAKLLQGRRERIRKQGTNPAAQRTLDSLVADEILKVHRGAYRASHIALYSTFLGPPPPMNTVTLRETIQ